MGNILKKIISKITAPRVKYEPLIEVRVFKDAILHNLNEFQKTYPKLKFAPVLKSNAYGHGLVEVAKILDIQNLPFFMVDSFYEALVLKQNQIKSKILILGYVRTCEIISNKLNNVSYGIIDLEQLKNLVHKLNQPRFFHLKIDTGMHRQGILTEQVEQAIKLIKQNPNFILEGLCTHYADADGETADFTQSQIQKWNRAATEFKKHFPDIKYLHTSNTAGSHYSSQFDANVGRTGLGLYGINPSPFAKLNLKPALEMVSVISSLKTIPAGEKVGYGITFTAQKDMVVATVPVGYNEGVDRRLSSKGFFKVGDVFCPLVGRVSMNISSIDVSNITDAKLEDETVIISSDKDGRNSVENVAKLCDCIPYEILVHIPQHLRRNVI